MPDFSKRSTKEELMDDPDAPETALWQNLKELEVVNKYLGGYRLVINAIKRIKSPKDKFSVMDLGSGGGDTLRAIAHWMQKKKASGKLLGVDRNPVMNKYANMHAASYPEIEFITCDIFDPKLDLQKPSIVTCSLFCHHFEHQSLVLLIRRMHSLAGDAVIINDLHRHWLAYYSIKIITAVFSKSYFIKNDAPLSVARAFTRKDWQKIMTDAGVSNYNLSWKWAFRWMLIISMDKHE